MLFDFIPTAVVLYSILCIRLPTASKTSAVPIACNMKSAEVEHMAPQTCRVGLRPKVQNREPIWVLYSQLNPHKKSWTPIMPVRCRGSIFLGKVSLWYKRFVYFFTEGVSLCQKIYLCVTSYSCLSTSFRWYVGQPATGSTCHMHKLECTTSR